MVSSKKGQKGSKKTHKRKSAADAKASKALEQEVKDLFTEHQKAFQLAKKKHAAQKADTLKSGDQAVSDETAIKLIKLADEHLDPDYTLVDPAGNVVQRQKVVEDFRKFGSFDQHKRTNHQVRIDGNTAVSVSEVTMNGIFEGHDITGTYRETHLLVKRRGTWSILHTHMALIQPRSALFRKVADTDVTD